MNNKPNINVTPLIDVLLVLLIIFMVVSPLKPANFRTKIPQEPKEIANVDTNPDALVIVLNALFGLWWADAIAALVMIPIIAKEGIEALQGKTCCDNECH